MSGFKSDKFRHLRDILRNHAAERSESVESSMRTSLAACRDAGVFRWFVPTQFGGDALDEADIVDGYIELAQGDLATTFIITQWAAAVRRILVSDNHSLRDAWLERLLAGNDFTSVGISHLTTSRMHLDKPAMRCDISDDGATVRLNGLSPWVTGAPLATMIVTGGVTESGEQVLVALPTDTTGVTTGDPAEMVALTESLTGPVFCDNVTLGIEHVLAGPANEVMKSASYGGSGGLQTSTLALGLAAAAIGYLEQESTKREGLKANAETLRAAWQVQYNHLVSAAHGNPVVTQEALRTSANGLVLRATQSALLAAKGTGYLAGHPVGRWCREALFFLVWSCPQNVQQAHLCELANAACV